MAINFGNVNISLQQFQEISSGKYNAGEVKLTSENKIDKVNDHVTLKFLNDVKISQVEVLAIKNAFIEALRGGGVTGDALVKIREELGLSPMKPVDKSLHEHAADDCLARAACERRKARRRQHQRNLATGVCAI